MTVAGKKKKAPIQSRAEFLVVLWRQREVRLRELEQLRETLHSMGLSEAVLVKDEPCGAEPPQTSAATAVKFATTDAQRAGVPRYLWEPTFRARLLLVVVDALEAMNGPHHRYLRARGRYLRDFFEKVLELPSVPAYQSAFGEIVMRSDTWAKKPAVRLIDNLRGAVWGRAQEILFEAGEPCAPNIKAKLEARERAVGAQRSRAARRAIAKAVIEPAYESESGEIVMPSALSAPGPGDDEVRDPSATLDALRARVGGAP
jgi:hypothetical protein